MLKDQSKEGEKQGSVDRLRRYIMERVGHGQDPEEFPVEMLLSLDEEDKEWFARLVRKAGGIYRRDEDADAEEEVVAHGARSVDLQGRRDIEVAAEFYPTTLERPLTAELSNRIMGHVQRLL